ncbi:hypothetical protein AB0B63_07080 [Micromonospora sp. NPDC049081]|uniref:hypothetical protein n=1 Tax=Micromonospora sp. NPDC049081 TaxID=3155150 RepID=UPI0033E27B5E
MSTDTVTVVPATGSMLLDQYATDNGHTVIDQQQVHRDRMQVWLDRTPYAAGTTGIPAALLLGLTQHTSIGYGLASVTGLIVAAGVVLAWRVHDEGRNWTYATTDEPA